MATLTIGQSGSRDGPFAGIVVRLQRADENIVNLTSEIRGFLQASEYPVIPDPNVDRKEWQKAIDYHRTLHIPLRFSVLAGEVVHHLRCCLDHIVWIFSSEEARRERPGALGFPVICDKSKLPRIDGYIKGITKPRVRKLIEDLQPCHLTTDPADDPLCIIHDMDRFDKHRELTIVTACVNLTFPGASPEVIEKVMAYQQRKTLSREDVAVVRGAVKNQSTASPQVAFAQFGKRKDKFVTPSLAELLNATGDIVNIFWKEL